MIGGILTYLDAALLAIVALSGLVAMYRGFTREVLSILSWVIAGLALLYFIRSHRALAEEVARQFSDPVQTVHVYIAQVAIGAIIFGTVSTSGMALMPGFLVATLATALAAQAAPQPNAEGAAN